MWPGPEIPYNNLPALPPKAEIETPSVFRLLIDAHRELSALQESCRRLPDPSILINAVPLLEAQASSEIENIVTTNDELFKANSHLQGFETSPAAKEALRYRAALLAGVADLDRRPLSTGRRRFSALPSSDVTFLFAATTAPTSGIRSGAARSTHRPVELTRLLGT